MEMILQSSVGVMGVMMAVLFLVAGFKLWQEARQGKAGE